MRLYQEHGTSARRGIVSTLAFSPDGHFLASGSLDGSVVLYDAEGPCQTLDLQADFERLYDLSKKEWPGSDPLAPSPIHAAAFLDNQTLAIGGREGLVRYRHTEAGWRHAASNPFHPGITGLAALSPHLIALGSGERGKATPGSFELYNIARERTQEPSYREPQGVRTVAANAEKKLVAWSSGSKQLNVWDVRRQTPQRYPAAHQSPAIALAADGTALAAAQDWTVRIIDLDKKQERCALKGHKGFVSAVAFSPGSSVLATGSWDETVRLWDASSGRELASYQWPIGKVFGLAYAPDGLRLAAGGERGAVIVWDAE